MAERVKIDFSAPYPVDYQRKKWFLRVENITRKFVKKSDFFFLGEKPVPRSIVLSNHEGTNAPLAIELYSGLPIRFWGAHAMNNTLKTAYQYQTKDYYHQRKHWNLHLARVFCVLATPLTRMFYRGLELISTHKDMRFKNTLNESIKALQRGDTLVIFPEHSETGYHKELVGFQKGALMLFEFCRKHGLDVPVYVAYYKKDTKQYIFDAPVTVNQLLDLGLSREELAKRLCERCNELGRMEFN